MHLLAIVRGVEPSILGDLPLSEDLSSTCGLHDDIILVHFPQSFFLTRRSDHQEVDWSVPLATHLLVFLHQTEIHLSLLSDSEPELWVVEPFVVGVHSGRALRILIITINLPWIGSTSSLALPRISDRVLLPRWREDLTNIQLVEVCSEIFKRHPPCAILLKRVFQRVFETFILVPSFVFITELAVPAGVTPRISDFDQLEAVLLHVTDVLQSISVVLDDATVEIFFLLVAVLVLD